MMFPACRTMATPQIHPTTDSRHFLALRYRGLARSAHLTVLYAIDLEGAAAFRA
jgi:hypothetical protein